MPKGDLPLFDKGCFNGSIEVQSFTKGTTLRDSNKSVSYPFELEKEPSKLYVIASVERAFTVMPKLRIWLNDFSLSKEFKPNVEVNDGNSVFSTIIYDISPFGKKGRNELNFVRSSNDSMNVINVTVVSFYRDDDLKTDYKLNAGTIMLGNKETLELENMGKGILILGGKRGLAKVFTAKDILLSSYFMESDELEVNTEGKLKVTNEEGTSTLVFFYGTFSVVSPEIRINPQVMDKDGSIFLSVRNESDVQLDKMVMNLTVNGVTKFFKVYSPVRPNEELTERVSKSGEKLVNVNLRVVGVKSGMRIVIDKPLK